MTEISFIIATGLSFINTICFCISNFRKTKKDIVFLHMCCNICDLVMYLILGARTGLANAIANVCKNAAYSKFNSMFFMILFSILRITLLALGYEGLPTILFIVCEIISIFILKYGTTQQFRILSAVRQGIWVIYDCMYASVVIGLLTSVGFISCTAAVVKNMSSRKQRIYKKN